ncbi:hypothetical protein AAGG74_15190 [Bacillus mexicanus]|uniref:hypothetical protein n=1 Tax=Bacillus mexicanus TaxID=2834415 RepID=UPI003D1A2EEC
MSPYSAVGWLSILKETLSEKTDGDKLMAINFAINSIKENVKLKADLEEWVELFTLIKKDKRLSENKQTNEWMNKAREMGLDI